MGDKTSIQWTDATWNPVRGCSRVSDGCTRCYAERIAARFTKPGRQFHGFAKIVAPRDHLDAVGGRRNGWTGRVEMVESALDWPLRWRGSKQAKVEGRPSRIFTNSMSDLFHEKLSDADIDRVFAVMAKSPQHIFQVLTKRAERMRKYLDEANETGAIAEMRVHRLAPLDPPKHWYYTSGWRWPLPNVWLGVSVEDQATADERIPLLFQTPAAVRFVSYEPALGPVGFARHFPHVHGMRNDRFWIIVGGESGPGARPFDLAWARSAVEQCRKAGVACFVKQLGARPQAHTYDPFTGDSVGTHPFHGLRDRKGGDPSEWPEDLRVREFPKEQR